MGKMWVTLPEQAKAASLARWWIEVPTVQDSKGPEPSCSSSLSAAAGRASGVQELPYHSSFTELHKDAAIVAANRSA